MKKHPFKPGFEFIFSLSILAVLGLPPLVFAQTSKDLQITITNGDTTVNGKNIRDLSAADRKDAMKNISQITVISSDDKDAPAAPMMANGSNDRHLKITRMHINGNHQDSTVTLNYSMNNEPRHRMIFRDDNFNSNDDREHGMKFSRRNTQNFVYNNIDNEGAVTHVAYHVSDHPAMLDYDAAKQHITQMDMLELQDLSLVPHFTEGKTTLMFDLPAKTPAEVIFKDGKGNLMWSAKAVNGTFSKSFAMGLNGSYYLQVKQGSKIVVKKIEKE